MLTVMKAECTPQRIHGKIIKECSPKIWVFQMAPVINFGVVKALHRWWCWRTRLWSSRITLKATSFVLRRVFLASCIFDGREKLENEWVITIFVKRHCVKKTKWPSFSIDGCSMAKNTLNPFSPAFATEWTWASFWTLLRSVRLEHHEMSWSSKHDKNITSIF